MNGSMTSSIINAKIFLLTAQLQDWFLLQQGFPVDIHRAVYPTTGPWNGPGEYNRQTRQCTVSPGEPKLPANVTQEQNMVHAEAQNFNWSKNNVWDYVQPY